MPKLKQKETFRSNSTKMKLWTKKMFFSVLNQADNDHQLNHLINRSFKSDSGPNTYKYNKLIFRDKVSSARKSNMELLLKSLLFAK